MDTLCDTTSTMSSIGPFDALYGTLITVLANARCNIGANVYPEDYRFDEQRIEREEFDFIIVGAGSSGSVLANRLSEVSSWKVLLIEAGVDPPIESDIPAMMWSLMYTKYDWNYRTEPSEYQCRGMKSNSCYWPRGKMLGGSSSINGMLYVRGNPFDYDGWAADGNDGWSYADLLPYFKKLENYTVDSNDEYHGHRGYLNVEPYREGETLSYASAIRDTLIQAAVETGLPFVDDINGPNQKVGVTRVPGTLRHGVRENAARAYLSPVRGRSNLYIMKNATVTRILMDDERHIARGVQLYKDGRYWDILCTKEVILSAGAVNSPQLLMLSGIGPKEHLERLGLKVLVDLPVGENLQDHVAFLGLMFRAIDSFLKPTGNHDGTMNFLDAFYNYLTKKTDLSSLGVIDMMMFVDTTGLNDTYPNLQIHNYNFPPRSTALKDFLFSILELDPQMKAHLVDINLERELLLIAPTLLRPQSRGRIALKTSNPFDSPIIEPGYLTDRTDIDTLVEGIRFIIERLAETQIVKERFSLIDLTPKECRQPEDGKYYSDSYWECSLRHLGSTVYHPVGTCKMGSLLTTNSNNAVVDSRLKVYNTERLRVADASIMPNIVSGNTNIPCIMIGEKAADLIKMDWLKPNEQREEL